MVYGGVEQFAGGGILIRMQSLAAEEGSVVLCYNDVVLAAYGKGIIVVEALQYLVEQKVERKE